MTVQEILRELVAIPSPSSVSNLPLLKWVTRFLEHQGWQVEILPYTDEKGVDKGNLLAFPPGWPGAEAYIDLAFVCHTDTVPFSSAWSTATELTATADGTLLHGCGSCDVKGALACFLAAIEDLAVRPDVALILTADEEIGCKGMERLLLSTQLKIRSAIVSEPTSLRLGIAGKGYGLARITINGVEAHSAFPKEGLSAISLAAKLIGQIDCLGKPCRAEPKTAQTQDSLFDPPHTTLSVGVIEGGTAKNIVPGRCSFLVEWRPIPSEPPRAILAQLEWLCDCLHTENPKAHFHVESLRTEPGFAASEAGTLRLRLRACAEVVDGRFLSIGISFGSEASRLGKVAQEIVVIGPGDMHTAHSERECVPVEELHAWTRTLRGLLSA